MLTKEFLSNWEDYGLVQNIQFNQKFGLDEIEYCFNSNEGFPKIGVGYSLRREQLQSGGIFSQKYEDCFVLMTTEIGGGVLVLSLQSKQWEILRNYQFID